MIIYRVEVDSVGYKYHSKSGMCGIYSTEETKHITGQFTTLKKHPLPYNKRLNYYYGFDSIVKLKKWFHKDFRKQLSKSKVKIYMTRYQVRDCYVLDHDGKQNSFNLKMAKYLDRTPIGEI